MRRGIGILTRSDMDKFGFIFEHLLKLGRCDKKGGHHCLYSVPHMNSHSFLEKESIEAVLAPYRDPNSIGHNGQSYGKGDFTIKYVYTFTHEI